MKPLQLLIAGGLLAFGFHSWHAHRAEDALVGADGYALEEFQSTAMPREARPGTVLIVAPVNCPANAARTRPTEALATELTRRGVPNTTTMMVSFIGARRDDPVMERLQAVMEAGPPVVFVNGLSKANPSPEEVEETFRRTRSGG